MIIKTKERMVTKMSRLWTLAAMTVAVTGFSSCLKNSNPEPQKPVTYVAFVNSLATTYGTDINMDNKIISSKSFAYGAAEGTLFTPGFYKFTFEKYGTDSLLADVSATFDTSRYNTLILYGTQAVGAKIHRIREDWANPSTTKANVRFFNFIPGTEPIDLFIGGVKVFGGRVFEDFKTGQYDVWTAAELGTHVISAKTTAGTEVAVLNSGNINARGGFYNIYLQGVKDSSPET